MSPWKAQDSREDYRLQIEQAVAYINANLSAEINLEAVARQAAFSPFHFHRVFSALVGETPSDFINRVRLEKAANMLVKNPACSVTEAGFACGFSSSAVFSRSFKKYFGISASQFRTQERERFTQLLQTSSRPRTQAFTQRAEALVQEVRVQVLPRRLVAAVTTLEGYSLEKICTAWNRLHRWAQARGCLGPETLAIGISYDDPFITPGHKCRYSACLTVSSRPGPNEPVGWLDISEGRYAVCRATCLEQEIPLIYHALYGVWLPDSGYLPADLPTYEIYYHTPDQPSQDANLQGKYVLEVCLPVA